MAKIKMDWSGLEGDIRKYLKTYAKSYAKQAEKQFTKNAQTCIEMFYNDYSPIYYDRTFDLLNNSYKPYFKNNGTAYYGGVRITADFMSPYYSGSVMNNNTTDPIIIAQLGWHGWHGDPTGYNGRFEPIHTSSPLDRLINFASNEYVVSAINKYAEKKALSQNYKYLKFK